MFNLASGVTADIFSEKKVTDPNAGKFRLIDFCFQLTATPLVLRDHSSSTDMEWDRQPASCEATNNGTPVCKHVFQNDVKVSGDLGRLSVRSELHLVL